MFNNPSEVGKYIEEEGVEFIDIRFCDLPGVMQHFNIPASTFDAEAIATGQLFDGSLYTVILFSKVPVPETSARRSCRRSSRRSRADPVLT